MVPNEHLKHACIVPVCLGVIVDARLIAFQALLEAKCDLDDVDSLRVQGAKGRGDNVSSYLLVGEVVEHQCQPSLNGSRTSGLWNVWRNHTAPCIYFSPFQSNLNLSLFRGYPSHTARYLEPPIQPKRNIYPIGSLPI